MTRALLLTLLLCPPALGELDFTRDTAAEDSIEAVTEVWRAERKAAGDNTWWPWGAAVWSDATGGYVMLVNHNGASKLWRRQDDGTYSEVTDITLEENTTAPREDRPQVFDTEGDGDLDVHHLGNESGTAGGLLNNGDGTWTATRRLRVVDGRRLADVNGDGFTDAVRWRRRGGDGTITEYVNDGAGVGFTASSHAVKLPEGAPQEVQEYFDAKDDRFGGWIVYTGDFNGDGVEDFVASYATAYSGSPANRVCFGDGEGGYTVSHTLPQTSYLHPPIDINGDGLLDFVAQWRSSAGIYYQTAPGAFEKQTAGDAEKLAARLANNSTAYTWDVWQADLDGDGDGDLVLSERRNGVGYIVENDAGVLTIHQTVDHTDGRAMSLGDGDGDGDLDVFSWGEGADRDTHHVQYWENLSDVAPDPDPDPEPTPQEVIAEQLGLLRAAADDVEAAAESGSQQSLDAAIQNARDAVDALDEVMLAPVDETVLLSPETLGDELPFESGTEYRLTPGVYPPLELRNVEGVTIRGEPGVVIKGRGLHGSTVTVDGCQDVVIEGIEATGGKACVALYRGSGYVVRDCYLHDGEFWNVFTSFTPGVTIENNQCVRAGIQHNIYVSNSGDDPVVRGNRCFVSPRAGIQLNGDRHSGGDGYISGAVVEGNRTASNGMGANLDGVQGRVVGNTFGGSVRCFAIDGAAPTNVLIEGNTITKRGGETYAVKIANGSTVNLAGNVITALGVSAWPIGARDEDGGPVTLTESGNVVVSDTKSHPLGTGEWGQNGTEMPNSTFVRLP